MGKRHTLPGQTCPDIDYMIRCLKNSEGEELTTRDVNNLVDQLEDLRTSNAQLRGIAEEAIDEVVQLEVTVSKLEDDVAVSEDRITDLEGRLDSVSKKAVELEGERFKVVSLNKELEKLLALRQSLSQFTPGRGQDEGYLIKSF